MVTPLALVLVLLHAAGEPRLLQDEVAETEEDPLPPLADNPVTRPGDIWVCDDNRVGCGDARDVDFIGLVFGDEAIQLAFVDSPYNVPVQGHVTRQAHREFAMASGEMDREAYKGFQKAWLAPLFQVLAPGGYVQSCIDWRSVADHVLCGEAAGFTLANIVVWSICFMCLWSRRMYRGKPIGCIARTILRARYVNAGADGTVPSASLEAANGRARSDPKDARVPSVSHAGRPAAGAHRSDAPSLGRHRAAGPGGGAGPAATFCLARGVAGAAGGFGQLARAGAATAARSQRAAGDRRLLCPHGAA